MQTPTTAYLSPLCSKCPTGSGDEMNLANVAEDIQHRIINLFARDHEGNRACNGGSELLNKDPFFRDFVPFHGAFPLGWSCLSLSLSFGWSFPTGRLTNHLAWMTDDQSRRLLYLVGRFDCSTPSNSSYSSQRCQLLLRRAG